VCLYRDDWPAQDFNNAIQKAKDLGYETAYSNEAFELWYVLHFEFLSSGIPRSQYIQKISQRLGKTYKKNSDSIYDDLLHNQHQAIKHAEKLLNSYDPHKPASDNPCTTVHQLVQELNRFAR
jgi:hypothetical protein